MVEPIQGHAEGPESVGATKLLQAGQHCATQSPAPGPRCIEKGNEKVLGELQEGQIHLQKSDLS